MQPNSQYNPYPQAAVPNYGGQPYPQTPPVSGQPGVPVQQPVQAIPRSAYEKTVPGAAIPEVMPDESVKIAHKKTVLADGTVLPDVIYVKKRGAQIGFALTAVFLIACAIYAIMTTVDLNNTKKLVDDYKTHYSEANSRLEMVRKTLDFNSIDQITEGNLRELVATPEGAVDIDMSAFNSGSGVGIKWVRISSNFKYMLADVSYYGTSSYFYRTASTGGWAQAFSRTGAVSCRQITKEAMVAITELGGIDKSVSPTGKQYDCLDPKDGDKLYDFADALDAGIYKH
jgi:hypothetical protein